jgi:hypothetical protein
MFELGVDLIYYYLNGDNDWINGLLFASKFDYYWFNKSYEEVYY